MSMCLGITDRLKPIHARVAAMVADEIAPLDAEYLADVDNGDRWQFTPRQTEILEGLKAKARAEGEVYTYLNTTLNAFREVENAIGAEELLDARVKALWGDAAPFAIPAGAVTTPDADTATLIRSLRAHGYLFLGHTDDPFGSVPGFEPVHTCNTFVYRKLGIPY